MNLLIPPANPYVSTLSPDFDLVKSLPNTRLIDVLKRSERLVEDSS
jgi:hypothetical protein